MAFVPSAFDLQCRVASLGFWPGTEGVYGARTFDGILGPKSKAAINACRVERGLKSIGAVPGHGDLFHLSGLSRIVLHWTAGAYETDESGHYHFAIAEDGEVEEGRLKPEANASTADGNYVAHTLGTNTGSIGVAVKAMGGARERPFDAGRWPITEAQLRGLVEHVAFLAVTYDIPVHRVSILTHAEVQRTLGRYQKQKWDITWLPGMTEPGDAVAVGDKLRALIQEETEAIRAS